MKKLIYITISFIVSLYSVNAQNKTKFDNYSDSAEININKGNYDLAIEFYNKAIQLKPDIADTYKYRGMSKIYNKDTVGACLDFFISEKLGYVDKYNDVTDFESFCYMTNGQINKKLANSNEFKKLNFSPLSLIEAGIFYDNIGTPVLRLNAHNNFNKTVNAFKCSIKCYNRFNEPVNNPFSESNKGTIINQETIYPGCDGGFMTEYAFYFQEEVTKIKIILTKVHFIDDTVWESLKEQEISIVANTSY